MTKVEPQWVKQTLCEDLADVDRARGRLPDSRAIEQLLDADLQHWEALQRQPAKKVVRDVVGEEHAVSATEQAVQDKTSGVVYKGKSDFVVEKQVYEAPAHDSPLGKLRLRLLALIAPKPDGERKPGDIKASLVYPDLGGEVLRVWSWLQLARPIAKRAGKTRDLERKCYRLLENIADRSTAIIGLGAWR